MAHIQTRLSTLAEIKVFSLETLINFGAQGETHTVPNTLSGFIDQAYKMKELISNGRDGIDFNNIPLDRFFKTVGIARQIRIDEDYGTQNIYAIGSPTRPRIIPNNFSANVTCERLQLDTRGLYDFMSTPEYFYSPRMQSVTGILDAVYYTYMFVRSKERATASNLHYDVYALMPRTSSRAVTSGDVMIAQNVQLTGFKVNYGNDGVREFLDGVRDDITRTVPLSGGGGGGQSPQLSAE